VRIREERAEDRADVRQVHREAFGREDEARLVDALRDGGYARLSLVADIGPGLVGHILFSALPIETAAGIVPALSLAPVAVLPRWQRQGVGSALIRAGLEQAAQDGHRIVVVLGHAGYYPRFGFSAELARPLKSPFQGEHWMALELTPGALTGVSGNVRYPPPFGIPPEPR
jgi:putative acetyltransferase